MATSLAVIILLGLLANTLFTKLKLPGLLGMLILGVIIGPYVLNWLTPDILNVSADFRKIALIIILLRAGLGISRDELERVGSAAIKLSFVPGLVEGFTIAFVSTRILGFSFIEGGILGFIIAAVSPAVVVPQMLYFTEKGIGTNKGIPTLILAGSSIDDVFAITIFTTFLGLYSGSHVNIGIQLLNIPVSILLGIGLGIIIGLVFVHIFKKYHIRDSKKVLYILGASILLTTLENVLKNRIEIAGLLGVMTIGFIILEKRPEVAKRLAVKFNKIWIFAEILLFVLVGAQVNITVAFNAGLKGLVIIFAGLIGRSIGVIISTLGTNLNWKEKLFCVISYIPKATVQAAIGAIPLSLGVKSGEIILAVAVLSILVTAPLGAIGIKVSAGRLLETEV
ncbi:MAG: solute carrier family (sodium/hydrogen exchanger), er 1/2 [Petroclostridium sp.]|uniref:cation:proton antiporter n=1 Tax=Petroclostridium xylanilyticum TaxID=1792311 RepID=UPI000B98E018|nr:cation:proton antiporter [Petroclostridium xylanilyticum]MBZ4645584.1 Na(+)/H(+) antiporter [Clostridia bacterium]MDK2809790.1 solute carrier family (sodium/hydrogen exchanger), er 1/2 [Petroclostridium sp.]